MNTMDPARHFIPAPEGQGPTGEALCALCARAGNCCCATEPALGYLSFPLSIPEWRRLAPCRGLVRPDLPAAPEATAPDAPPPDAPPPDAPPHDAPHHDAPPPEGDAVCRTWPNAPDFIDSMQALFPGKKERIGELFPGGKQHFSLRLRPDGACVFLGDQGCRLPRSVRPWYCLLFPVWVIKGRPCLFTAKGCLVTEKSHGPMHAIRIMEQNMDEVRCLYARLCLDWGID